MRPILYNATETVFDSYGLGEINANKATVTRERNGNYSLYIEYPVGGSLTPLFKQDMRIKADAGVRTKNQTFYISRIVKDSSHVIKIYAKHISHLTETTGIVHGTTAVGDANAALARWSESLVGGVEFRTWSDIETEGKASWTVDKFRTAREALGGVEGSILDVWGGEYEFDNTTIRLHKQLGRKTPTVLQYGRNILSAEEDENSESSYTSIYPYASYTPEADEGGRQADPVFVTLPEKIVDSQWVKMYADRRVQVVDFSSKFAEKETPTLDKLRKIAERYVHDNRIGIPKTSIKVEYVDLAKTLDYADMAFMEEVELCDIVPIFYPKIGLTNEDGKVVVVNYDVLNDRNESIEIGTIGQGMKSAMVGSLGERLETLENRQIRLESNIPAYLLDGKGNKVWYQTPDNKREHKVGDTWFEKNGLYDRIYVWNGEMWEKRIDTEDVNVIAKEIDNKFKDFKSSTKLIEQKAEEALRNAGASSLLAQEAKRIGLDSIAKLEEFKTQATSAQMTLSSDLDDLANEVLSKQEQIKDEVDEQVEALIQTKKELAGVKSAQATYEETTTRRLAELINLANGKASKSELTQTAEELASKIASVQAGSSRNYFRNSRSRTFTTGDQATYDYRTFIVPDFWKNGGRFKRDYVRISFDVTFPVALAKDTQANVHFGAHPWYGYKLTFKGGTVERQHFEFTIDLSSSSETYQTNNVFIRFGTNYGFPADLQVVIENAMLSVGNYFPAYQSAYEDQEDRVSVVESNFKQRADALDAGVNRLTEGLRAKADISSLNVTAENIRQSVKSLETSTQNKLDKKLSMAEFEVRASGIRQEIVNATKDKADKTLVVAEAGKLREEFSKMKVGSRNYAEDYDFSRGLWHYSQGDNSPQDWTISNGEYNVKGTTNTWKQIQIHSKEGSRSSWKSSTALLDLEIGETYTLSFQAMCYSGSSSVWLSLRANRTVSGNPGIMYGNFNLTSSWQTYQVTIPALTKPDNFDFWRIILGYDGIGHVAFRKVELTRSSTRIDAGPAPEDGKTDLVVAKSEFEKTAEGLSSKLATVETYVSQDGQRQEALRKYSRDESARQATTVRELVSRDFVGKATYQEDVRGISQRIEAVKTEANKEITNQLASYRQSVDGKFTDISSQITTYKQDVGGQISGLSNRLTSSEQGTTTQISNLSNRINSNKQGADNQISNLKTQVATNKDNAERQMGRISDQVSANKANADSQFSNVTNQLARKVEVTDFQKVKETSQLYERILGTTENGITDKVARMALTNQLFQVEVAKASAGGRNLFLNSLFKYDLHQRYSTYHVNDSVDQTQGQLALSIDANTKFRGANTLKIVSTFNGKPNNQKVTFRTGGDMRLNTADEMRNKSVRFSFWAKSTVNNTNFQARAGYRNAVEGVSLTTDWKFYDIQLTKSENSNASNEVIMHVFTAATVWIAFPKVEIGTVSTPFSEAPEDTDEAIRSVQSQLAGSWAVQNINSAGDLISGINLGANGHNRLDGKLTHITGETLIDNAVIKSAMVGKAQINTAHIGSIDATNGRIINLSANNFTANRVEGLNLIGGDLTATNGAMKINLNKGQYEVYTEEAAMRRVVAGFPNQFIKFATGKQEVEHEEGVKSGVTVIGSNSDGSENGNNQTFAGIQIWNNPQQRNVNSIGDYLRVSNKGFGENEKGWIIQTSDTPTIGPIVDKNKPETGKRSAVLSGDFYFINKWGQSVSLLGILERFIVNFNTLRDKRGMLYTDFPELN